VAVDVRGIETTQGRAEVVAELLTEFAAHLNAGTARWLQLVAGCDELEGWAGDGIMSCAHWLTWRCGIAPVTAREQVRVARPLRDLPLIENAFADGRVSYFAGARVTRCATPENQEFLLDLARDSTAAQLERITRNYRRYERLREAHDVEKRHSMRSVTVSYDEEGFVVIMARLLPEDGQVVLKALQAAERWSDEEAREDVSAETPDYPEDTWEQIEDVSAEAPPRPTKAAKAADALLDIAEIALEHGPQRRDDDRYQVVVHVDADTLTDDSGDICELEEGCPWRAPPWSA
jgi:hypothetical protein